MIEGPEHPRPGRRRVAVAGAGLAAAAVALVALPLRSDAAPRTVTAVTPTGDIVCGDVRFDRSELPGRPVDGTSGLPTDRAADLLDLHGWPRAVPYDRARWTVLRHGGDGLLIATTAAGTTRYLPIHRDPDHNWTAGPPCTPA